nr:hypothetical protein [Tanacetum cinerariifolium]
MEEINLFLTSDDSMPLGIKNDDYDSKGDILFLEELLSNDSPSLPENESFHFDIPSSPLPTPLLETAETLLSSSGTPGETPVPSLKLLVLCLYQLGHYEGNIKNLSENVNINLIHFVINVKLVRRECLDFLDREPELLHVNFWNISENEKGVVERSVLENV